MGPSKCLMRSAFFKIIPMGYQRDNMSESEIPIFYPADIHHTSFLGVQIFFLFLISSWLPFLSFKTCQFQAALSFNKRYIRSSTDRRTVHEKEKKPDRSKFQVPISSNLISGGCFFAISGKSLENR